MSHQLATDSAARLPPSVASTSSYSFPTAVTYPNPLLPTSSTTTHISHSGPPTSSSYQQTSSHQLSPTPNSLVTMMGPNSSNSNSATDQLNSSELPISSVSPAQQQQAQPQNNQGTTSPSWNLAITASGSRVNLQSPPSSLQQPHAYSAHPHQAFANHYTAQGFQQPARPAPQSFHVSWFWKMISQIESQSFEEIFARYLLCILLIKCQQKS